MHTLRARFVPDTVRERLVLQGLDAVLREAPGLTTGPTESLPRGRSNEPPGAPVLAYAGAPLTSAEEHQVRLYIDFLRTQSPSTELIPPSVDPPRRNHHDHHQPPPVRPVRRRRAPARGSAAPPRRPRMGGPPSRHGLPGRGVRLAYPVMALPVLADHGVIADGWMSMFPGLDTERDRLGPPGLPRAAARHLVVTWAADGKDGLRDLVRRMFRWRIGVGWWLLVLTGLPVLTLAFAVALGDTSSPSTWGRSWPPKSPDCW